MNKSNVFSREIGLIKDENLRKFAEYYFEEWTPDYFFEIGASSSGKYHPAFSQGTGGLVRHTKAVVMFAEELLRMSSYAYMPERYKDYVIMACLFHDTAKYGIGEYDKTQYKKHGENAGKLVDNAWYEMFRENASELLVNAIVSHMGQWGEVKPFTNIDRCVHMADYMASRSFIDIPALNNMQKENE